MLGPLSGRLPHSRIQGLKADIWSGTDKFSSPLYVPSEIYIGMYFSCKLRLLFKNVYLLFCVDSLNTREAPQNSSSPNPKYGYISVQNENLANPYSKKQPAASHPHVARASARQSPLHLLRAPAAPSALAWESRTDHKWVCHCIDQYKKTPLTQKRRKDYKKRMYTALIRTGISCGRHFFSKMKQSNIARHGPVCNPVPALLPLRYYDGPFKIL